MFARGTSWKNAAETVLHKQRWLEMLEMLEEYRRQQVIDPLLSGCGMVLGRWNKAMLGLVT